MVENRRSRSVLSSSPTEKRPHLGLMDIEKERTSSKRLLSLIKPKLNDSERSILSISSCKLPSVQVALRIRPFASREKNTSSCIHYSSDPKTNTIQIDGNEPSFCFDHVLPEASTQAHVYEACVSELVTSCLDGYNATGERYQAEKFPNVCFISLISIVDVKTFYRMNRMLFKVQINFIK